MKKKELKGLKSILGLVSLLLLAFQSNCSSNLTINNKQQSNLPTRNVVMIQDSIKDYDGNEYTTIQIGDQVWTRENLRTTHYFDGTKIKGAFVYDDDESHLFEYGRLYTWDAITSKRCICPPGWHIPTDADWKELEAYLGMEQSEINDTGWRETKDEGIKLKKNTKGFLWINYSKQEINQSGFSGLPGGAMMPNGLFIGRGYYTDFWTATQNEDGKVFNRSLVWLCFHPGNSKIFRKLADKKWGFAVRLIKNRPQSAKTD